VIWVAARMICFFCGDLFFPQPPSSVLGPVPCGIWASEDFFWAAYCGLPCPCGLPVGCPAGPWAALGVSHRKKVVGFSFNITILPHIFRKSLMPKKAVVFLINNNFKVSARDNPWLQIARLIRIQLTQYDKGYCWTAAICVQALRYPCPPLCCSI
jgi:hypothetical protein